MLLGPIAATGDSPPPIPPGTVARYRALTTLEQTPPPVQTVEIRFGPVAPAGPAAAQWWQLDAYLEEPPETAPAFQWRALTAPVPFARDAAGLAFLRYQLAVAGAACPLEYHNRHTGQALLPAWADFERHFLPRAAEATHVQDGVPETVLYLGHVLTLVGVHHAADWPPWPDVRVLQLDPELLIGTGRNFRDSEGARFPQTPQRQNYTYVPFTQAEYDRMIEIGFNLFTVAPEQQSWVQDRPVFYLRGAGGDPPLRYPSDLYRSNYLGPVMFMDEPAILMVGDPQVHDTLRYFSDASALLTRRVHARYHSDGHYGAYALECALAANGVNLGDMRLMQPDYPAWETLYETAFYQMAGGLNGIVHEGRYQLAEFDRDVARFTGQERAHTAEELLLYHYAFLRGAARAFGKHWGTAIYGQCDPAIAPLALTLAYDMGARYLWFWTSDHDHHVPWPEQLALVSHVRAHAAAHPRPSIAEAPPTLDAAIVVPRGYFLSLGNLWWVRALDPEGKNEAATQYHRLMRQALEAVHDCLDRGESFDIVVDSDRPPGGYRRVIRLELDRDAPPAAGPPRPENRAPASHSIPGALP